MKKRELFVIHTEKNEIYRNLYHEMISFMEQSGFEVWKYGDWQWKENDERRYPHHRFLSDLDKIVYRNLVKPKIVEGDVDLWTIKSIFRNTEAIILFDMDKEEVTNGISEEMRLIDPNQLDFSYFSGSIGIVQFGDPKWISRQYSRIASGVLNLRPNVESYTPDKTGIQVQLLSLFSARLIIQGAMRKRNTSNEAKLGMLSTYLNKTKKLINSLGPDFLLPPYLLEISKLVETLMSKIHESLLAFGKEKLVTDYPYLLNWIINEFDGACFFQSMSERGLARVIEVLEILGSLALSSLEKIHQQPYYTDESGKKICDMDISYYSVRAISRISGEPLVDILSKDITDSSYKKKWIPIGTLGRFAKYSGITQIKAGIAKLLLGVLKDENSSAKIKESCIEALEDCALQEYESPLRAFIRQEEDENVRRSAILFLMRILGKNASPIVVDFLKNASLDACRFIASAAWQVNTDELYEALSRNDLRKDEDVRANLLYSLVRTQNRRAPRIVLEELSSSSDHLRAVVSGLASECIERCNCTPEERKMIVDGLKNVFEKSEGERIWALFSLLELGEEEFISCAEDVLDRLIAQGDYELAAAILRAAGVGFNNWPESKEARKLLFHSSDQIRLFMTYVMGYQRREEFLKDLELLKGDTSIIYPNYYINPIGEIMGRSVSEAATTAINSIKGLIALEKLSRYKEVVP